MTDDLDSVKTTLPEGRAYHHGSLRSTLLSAAEALIEERGLDRFSLRETARRAGVSPAAPAHHFGDARGLLTAIATEGFQALGDALEAADVGEDRHARVISQGRAYVRFALACPARFTLMWRKAILDVDDPAHAEAGRRAFQILDRAVRGEGAERSGPRDPALAPSIACWSIVHGFALLALDGAFGSDEDAPELAAESLLPLVLGHLAV
ncbi:MAG TPA: TetR/AcrR family transcriptional regulator [Sphingomicrobium sp.]|nr:TetR/AcrR family transcriptional regulator [Sphingomicrobium sp.]